MLVLALWVWDEESADSTKAIFQTTSMQNHQIFRACGMIFCPRPEDMWYNGSNHLRIQEGI
jgi:hypothetical protein